jgi:hypothetical protein
MKKLSCEKRGIWVQIGCKINQILPNFKFVSY